MRAALCLLVVSLTWLSAALADPRDRFVDDGTFLVASIDIEQLVEPNAAKRLVATLGEVDRLVGEGTLPPAEQRSMGVQFAAASLRRAGVRQVLVVAGIDDIRIEYAPLVVCELIDKGDPQKLLELIKGVRQVAGEQVGNQVWISTPKSLKRYRKLSATPRPDLLQPLVAAGQADPLLSLIVSPGEDARRVIREVWPTLPAPLEALSGSLVADGMRHLEVTASLKEPISGGVRLVAADEASRERFAQVATAGLEQGVAWVRKNQPDYADLATQAASVIDPQSEGTALSVSLSGDQPAVRKLLTEVAGPMVQKARERSRRASKMNDMKQLGLAMLNFESANGCYPGPIVDEQGKPLLSWRVAILPFLEQQALYDQFHLDEPWDSEHNLRVARAIPGSLANSSHDELNARGLTTYLRPVYPGSDLAAVAGKDELIKGNRNGQRFFYAAGDLIRKITDGTSNSILVAEVAPEHAVFWTKPVDWEVDLENPMAKLRTDKRDGFVTAWHDGHAKFLQFTMPVDTLRAVITKAGGEIVKWDGSR